MDDEKLHLETLYKEVCQNHRAITDFRAKLLTLLPLASGTGISLLLTNLGKSLETIHLVAVGTFGILVTLGLFLHELRGIGHCGELIRLGRSLEEKMKHCNGQFALDDEYYHKGEHKFWKNLRGPVGAAWIIYPTVIAAWLYVALSPILGR